MSIITAPSLQPNIYQDNWKYKESGRKQKNITMSKACECGYISCGGKENTEWHLCESLGCTKYLIRTCKYRKCFGCSNSYVSNKKSKL